MRHRRMAQTPILRRHNKRQANTVTRRLAAALLCMWVQGAEAAKPTLTAPLDTAQITLGDPLHLRLIVDRDAGQRTLFPDR